MGRRDHRSSAADPKLCASIPGAGSCVGRNWAGAFGFLVLMTCKRTTNRSAARRIVALLAFAGLCAALTAAIGMSTAGAKKATVIGKTKSTPPPSCPNLKNQSLCQVVGRTTGYMTVASGQKHPFNVFKDGKIVAWAIDLSKPANSKKAPQRSYFGSLFENKDWGTHPTARLSILKRKEKHKFKLLKQTPVVDLQHEMGEKQVITLDKPLHVHPGQVVARAIPIWVPQLRFRGEHEPEQVAGEPQEGQLRSEGQLGRRKAEVRAQQPCPPEGRDEPLLRLQLHRRAAPVLGLLRAQQEEVAGEG